MNANVYNADRPLTKPPQKPRASARKVSEGWLVTAGLILLSFIPVVAGAFRLNMLAGGEAITSDNARFIASPLPVIVHIISASTFAILGAFQFATGFRRRFPGWHRAVGKLVVVCGLLVGLSGLWMTLFYYPRPADSGVLLVVFRLFFGSTMLVSIVRGFVVIRRGKVNQHRAWMLRAYAIGLGAGTQALTQMIGSIFISVPTELSTALLMGAGWVINLAVAEWAIRKHMASPARVVAAVVSQLP
jgi:uncharacterized membrane protein